MRGHLHAEYAPGHVYIEVGNLRITYVPSKDRPPEKDWPGCDVIRIQAYRDSVSSALHRGAELPITGISGMRQMVKAIRKIYFAGRK